MRYLYGVLSCLVEGFMGILLESVSSGLLEDITKYEILYVLFMNFL